VALSAQAIGQPARLARLTEFRFGDLLRRLRELGVDAFDGVPAPVLPLGLAVLRLVGDDLDGLAGVVQDLTTDDRRLVVDEIAPRIRRLREQRAEVAFDRETMLQNLMAARVAAQDGTGPLVALERELAAFQSRVPEAARSGRENVELRLATTWWRLARRRQDLLAELDKSAPRGAVVEVRIRDERLDAEVGLGASVLQRLVTDGWQRVDAAMQFAGAGRPWSQLASCRMQVRPGFDASVLRTRLTLDCVLPPAAVGARWYLVASRGVHVVFVVAANDGAYAATVDGDAMREENVQQAMQRALAGVLAGPPKVVVVPGAVHRLSLDVQATSSRTRAQVRVALDGVELGPPSAVDLAPQQLPDGVFYPLQEIAVQQAKVQAFDL
ncbi:MAG: hypothetical protein K8J09_11685, partial [Planctomycetes bacterium]|nr:hypothetical protein [Planctomycetota bacterium]